MAVSRRPLRGSRGGLVIRTTARLPRDLADPKAALALGEQVTVVFDTGVSVTLSHRDDAELPFRVVVLRMGRQVGPQWARNFADEALAREFARTATTTHYAGGTLTTEIRRDNGQTYKRLTIPRVNGGE